MLGIPVRVATGGLDPSIARSPAGLRTVGWTFAILLITAIAQATVYAATGSIALLADLIHNVGDAPTALALGVAGGRSALPATNSPRCSGCAPETGSTVSALIADGYHARTDGLVSLAVVACAIVVALGRPIADSLIGLVILRITWQSSRTVRFG